MIHFKDDDYGKMAKKTLKTNMAIGTSTMNESMYFLLNMGVFQLVMLSFQGCIYGVHHKDLVKWENQP